MLVKMKIPELKQETKEWLDQIAEHKEKFSIDAVVDHILKYENKNI